MNVEYNDGRDLRKLLNLTDEEVVKETTEALADPGVKAITIKRLKPKKGAARLPKKSAPLAEMAGRSS